MKQGDRIQNGHQYGFFMIPNEMIDSHIENMGALGFVVYSVLMRHANSSSQCFPSYSTLEKKSSLSRPTIAKCIENLVSKGYIQKLDIGNSRGHATTYQLLDLSLVPTSKGDLPVNEVNQSMSFTSKGGLPVTSKGGLPQLVNEVNSNNTNLTRPINNNTHIKESDFFEISLPDEKKEIYALKEKPINLIQSPPVAPPPPYSQATSDRIMQMRQAEKDKWTQPTFDCKKLSKDGDFVDFILKVYLPTVPDNRGKKLDVSQAETWIVKGQRDPARRDLVEIQIRAFEKHKQAQNQRSPQPTPQPIEEPKPSAPVPINVKEYAARLAKKIS